MLKIDRTKVDDYVVLKLDGEVDASNSVELDLAIQELVAGNEEKILVDGTSLVYISSAGLGVFMSYLEDIQEKRIKFIIFGLNNKVKNVFHILGLDQLLQIEDNEIQALELLYEG